jgi:hypothetical protein
LYIDGGQAVGTIAADQSASQLAFRTNGSERARITASGEFNVGGSELTSTSYAFQVSRDLGSVNASGTSLLRFRNANSTYSQDLYLKFNNSKDLKWEGGSGNGGMTWDMGTRGYSWSIGGTEKLTLDGAGIQVKRDSEQFNSFIRTGSSSDDDYIGNLTYRANDSSGNETQYVKLLAQIADNTDGTEDARYNIETMRSGTLTQSAKAESGYFLTPNNPGVYLDALDWDSANNYMHQGYQFWQVGSHWNNSSGTFTCPIAGKYFVAADAQGHNTHTQSGASNQYANLIPRVNNSNVGLESVATTKEDGSAGGGTATHTSFGFSIILSCNANDTIRVYSNHGFRSNTQNHLTIYLIG